MIKRKKDKPKKQDSPPERPDKKSLTGKVIRSGVKKAITTPYRYSERQGLSERQKAISTLRLEDGYYDAVRTQETFKLLKPGEKAPDFTQVMKVFTSEMLQAAQRFQEPRLILITKGCSFDDLLDAMDTHKIIPSQTNSFVADPYLRFPAQRPENWGAYIVEGAKVMNAHNFDYVELSFRKRLEQFATHKRANGLSGMDRFKYAQLMMQTLKEGEPIDADKWFGTILDEDPALVHSYVPYAWWYPNVRRVEFTLTESRSRFDYYRFRRSVGGEVPSS